jgi:CheY-like chemotaxis protein
MELRILIADEEAILRERLVEYLESRGFTVRIAKTGPEAKAAMAWKPHFVLYDLMLRELNALSFLKQCKGLGLIGEGKSHVFVMSRHNNPQNVADCLRAGASDFITKPVNPPELLTRLVLYLQKKREIQDLFAKNLNAEHFDATLPAEAKGGHGDEPGDAENAEFARAQYFIYLTDLLLREGLKGEAVDDCLFKICKMISLALKAVRVSIVKCDINARRGEVLASNDNKEINNLKLDLGRYPEIMFVLRSEKILALDNLVTDESMHFVAQQEKEISFNSIVVSPIRIGGANWGVMSIRLPDTKKALHEHEIRFAQLAANIAGLIIMRTTTAAGSNTQQPGSIQNEHNLDETGS